MKHSELLAQYYHARGMYLTALKAYVLLKGGVVECDQTERDYVSNCYGSRLRQVKYKSLISEGDELKVKYLVKHGQDGDWEEHEDQIEFFNMHELFHVTEDIISEEE